MAGAWAGAAWALGLGFEPHAVAEKTTAAATGHQARVVMLGAPSRTFRTCADPKLQARGPVEVAPQLPPPVDLNLVPCS